MCLESVTCPGTLLNVTVKEKRAPPVTDSNFIIYKAVSMQCQSAQSVVYMKYLQLYIANGVNKDMVTASCQIICCLLPLPLLLYFNLDHQSAQAKDNYHTVSCKCSYSSIKGKVKVGVKV